MCVFAGSGLDQTCPGSSEENYSSGCHSDQVSVCVWKVKLPLHVSHSWTVIWFLMCVRTNRDTKQILELDWSDKYQAYNLDDHCGRHNNMSPDTKHHPSSAALQEQWVYESTIHWCKVNSWTSIYILHSLCCRVCNRSAWTKYTQDNLNKALQEEQATSSLRSGHQEGGS